MNALLFTIVSLAITYCVGLFSKNAMVLSALCNIISLGMAFLGGVFVPAEIMSDKVLILSRFFPTYWYIDTMQSIMDIGVSVSNKDMSQIGYGFIIQIAFVIAIFAFGLVVSKKKVVVA